MSLAVDLIELLGSLSIIAWISAKIQEFFSHQNNQNEASELMYLRNDYSTHPTLFESSTLIYTQTLKKSFYLEYRHICLAIYNAVSIFLEEEIA